MTALGVYRAKLPHEEVAPLFDDSAAPESKWLNRQKIYVDMLNNKVAQSELKNRKQYEFLRVCYARAKLQAKFLPPEALGKFLDTRQNHVPRILAVVLLIRPRHVLFVAVAPDLSRLEV